MSDENSYLVPYELAPIGPGAYPYPEEGEWAEPDPAAAGRLMREAYEDRAGAAERGRRAAAEIRASHSPEVAGRVLRGRLELIRRSARQVPEHRAAG